MKKIIIFLALLSMTSLMFSQAIFFKLNDEEVNADFNSSQILFQQDDLQNLLRNYEVKSVLNKPLNSESKYGKRLELTYIVDLDSNDEDAINLIYNQLRAISCLEYVELYNEPIPLTCPSNDPSDAPWNLSRHEITCVQEAHCITKGNPKIIIGSRDNGYMTNHPEHAGQIFYAEPGAYNGACHGTQTSITSAGATNNGFGISSSGYNCQLALYRWGSDFVADYIDMCDRGVRIAHNSKEY